MLSSSTCSQLAASTRNPNNAWQHYAAPARSKMLVLTDAAMDAFRCALVKGDARTALVALKSAGILDRPTPGSIDPEEVKARSGIERNHAETQLIMDRLDAKMP